MNCWKRSAGSVFGLRGPRSDVVVGEPQETDALGSMEWARYTSSEALFDAWSPVAGSPWEAFHCVTLFAAIDRIPPDRLGPARPQQFVGRLARPIPPPPWAAEDVWAIVDLPGHESVAVAAWLCANAGFQTVSTFDNWPHKDGLIKPEMSLAALLRYADLVRMARQELSDKAPPVWICDRTRLGTRRGRPKEFDNRYYMDDSVLPGPQLLKSAGIRRVVYVTPGPGQSELPDFSVYFQLLQQQGFPLFAAAIQDDTTWNEPAVLQPSKTDFKRQGFLRASYGGFGSTVPVPSSSSG